MNSAYDFCSMSHAAMGSKPWSQKMLVGEGLGLFSFLFFLGVMDGDGECSSRHQETNVTKKNTSLGGEVVPTIQQLSLQ